MNKQKSIAHWKQIKEAAAISYEVAKQNMEQATRLETLADSALEELGNSPGRGLRASKELSPETILRLKASLTSGKPLV